jgi:ribonuclease HI
VKGHSGIPGIEHADVLAGKAAEKTAWYKLISLVYLKLPISEQLEVSKDE